MQEFSLGRMAWVVWLVVAIWAVQGVNLVTGYALNPVLGLAPRDVSGLPGVALMPMLHGSIDHAATNTPPVLVLGGLVALSAGRLALPATAAVVLGGGALVWILGRDAVHVGASGLIFGWLGFLLARGLVDRRLVPMAVAAGVALVYGAMVWGVLPSRPGVSWESHLAGFVAGIAIAVSLRPKRG
ncbi:MAG: rhomboid family intramembrane serine protease [Pseudomonadota bacterium]